MAISSMLKTTSLTDLLREDHRRMKDLFREFEGADAATRKLIARDALSLIQTHDVIEKKLLYPNAMEISEDSEELVLRCEEAHHVANVLLMELKVLPYSERYFAKFLKLAESIRAHIKEEETELFPIVEGSDMDLEDLGQEMLRIKESRENGFVSRNGTSIGAVVGLGVLAGIGYFLYDRFVRED